MNTDFQYFQSILFTDRRCLEYVTDKSKSAASIVNYMLSRLQQMFLYEGLPDSIPCQYLENYLLVNGNCVIGKDLKHPEDDNIYAFVGAAGGEPDIYYRPTRYFIANPSLQTSEGFYISETDPNHEPNAVIVRNDTMWQGLYPMMARYAAIISENLLTIRTADVLLRLLALITAPDDSSRLAANQFLKDIEEGKLASVGENRFLDGIHMQNPPSNNGSYLTQFIELHQYMVGSFYNEIGLNANYNMKREALSESETGLNDDSLMPLCENMLRCRQEDMDKVNAMFGTSIKVSFNSSWLENEIERLISLRQQASEASSQLVNPAPMEAGLGEVSLEGASMEGAGMSGENGIDDEENGGEKDVSGEEASREDVEETNEKPDAGGDLSEESGNNSQESEDKGNEENSSEDENDEGSDEVDDGNEDDGNEDDGNEDGSEDGSEDEKLIDESSVSDSGVHVSVEVEVKTPSDDEANEEGEEGTEEEKKEGGDGEDSSREEVEDEEKSDD